MEFWGVEVKSGKPLAVTNDFGKIVHLSQATMGESKAENTNESVHVFVTVGGQKFALGVLSSQKNPQLSFDLVLERDFELSHNWKSGNVFFLGYKSAYGEHSDDEYEEQVRSLPKENGKIEAKDGLVHSTKAKADTKANSKRGPVKKEAVSKEDDEENSSDKDDSSDDDYSSDDLMITDSDDWDSLDEDFNSDSNEDGDEDEHKDEETQKKVIMLSGEKGDSPKKRSTDSATKTPAPATKKAKFASPQKTEGKKGSHEATPHPKKLAGKTPTAGNKKDQTPKSGGSQLSCNSCKKTFNSDIALQSHTKAKHSAK